MELTIRSVIGTHFHKREPLSGHLGGYFSVREVPVPDHLVTLLRQLASPAGHAEFWQWGRTTAWRYVKAVMAAAGIAGLHAAPKGLRHGFGVHAVRSGVPLNLLQRWLGHKHIATTAIYADVMGAEEREIAAWMWKSTKL